VIGSQFTQDDHKTNQFQSLRSQLTLASSARSEKQRHLSLVALTQQLYEQSLNEAIETHQILMKVLPLLLDSSSPIRKQLIDLLRYLPAHKVAADAEHISVFVRAGLTHLSAEISQDALAVFNWLLDIAANELVSCPGGWTKSLASFCAILGWSSSKNAGWSVVPPKTNSQFQDQRIAQISTLTRLIHAGLHHELDTYDNKTCDWAQDILTSCKLSASQWPIEHVNIFCNLRSQDSEALVSREARLQEFLVSFSQCLKKGGELARQEGGTLGRIAALLLQTMQDGLTGYQDQHRHEVDNLSSLW